MIIERSITNDHSTETDMLAAIEEQYPTLVECADEAHDVVPRILV